ncbi:MAG: phosphoribosylformylglycinamidine synthase subunit PurS [Candidatus Cloacimonas sp.]|jgi:phosphoribosylformylglycinamidine synthase|nr:phosphoribosylformylglycinamidine synthase subunit PurS [Candidatus Cloacimonadota bacterium]
MIKANVYVTLKPSVLDPQGKAVMNALHSIGHDSIDNIRISKFIEIKFQEDDLEAVKSKVEEICKTVLANPNTETYRYDLVKL